MSFEGRVFVMEMWPEKRCVLSQVLFSRVAVTGGQVWWCLV